MRHLEKASLYILMIVANGNLAHAVDPNTCHTVEGAVQAVLRKVEGQPAVAPVPTTTAATPAVATTPPSGAEALQAYSSRFVARDIADARAVNQIPQDASFLAVQFKRDFGGPRESVGRAAIDAKLAEINGALKAKAGDAHSLQSARADLLEAKYLGKRDVGQVDTKELARIQEQLEADLKAFEISTYNVERLAPERLLKEQALLARVRKTLDARPGVREAREADQQERLQAAAAEVNAAKRDAEMAARRSHTNPAARPLTDAQATELEATIQAFDANPRAFTPEQMERAQQLRADLLAKNAWSEGQYHGLTPQDQVRADRFRAAWDRAAQANSERETATRSAGAARHDVNVVDQFNQPSRQSLVNIHGARITQGDREKIMIDLGKTTSGSERFRELVVAPPVLTAGEDVTRIASALSAVGVSKNEIQSANLITSLGTRDLDHALGEFSAARDLLKKLEAAQSSGRLAEIGRQMDQSQIAAVRALIQRVRAHSDAYVPPHLRMRRFDP